MRERQDFREAVDRLGRETKVLVDKEMFDGGNVRQLYEYLIQQLQEIPEDDERHVRMEEYLARARALFDELFDWVGSQEVFSVEEADEILSVIIRSNDALDALETLLRDEKFSFTRKVREEMKSLFLQHIPRSEEEGGGEKKKFVDSDIAGRLESQIKRWVRYAKSRGAQAITPSAWSLVSKLDARKRPFDTVNRSFLRVVDDVFGQKLDSDVVLDLIKEIPKQLLQDVELTCAIIRALGKGGDPQVLEAVFRTLPKESHTHEFWLEMLQAAAAVNSSSLLHECVDEIMEEEYSEPLFRVALFSAARMDEEELAYMILEKIPRDLVTHSFVKSISQVGVMLDSDRISDTAIILEEKFIQQNHLFDRRKRITYSHEYQRALAWREMNRVSSDRFRYIFDEKDQKRREQVVAIREKQHRDLPAHAKGYGFIAEAIIAEQTELANWLGEDVEVLVPHKYDDFTHGVDFGVHFKDGVSGVPEVFVCDLTVSNDESVIYKKADRISRRLLVGKLGRVTYFASDSSDYVGELTGVPNILIVLNRANIEELSTLWMHRDNKALAVNLVQFELLEQMLLQADLYAEVSRMTGSQEVAKKYESIRSELVIRFDHERIASDDQLKDLHDSIAVSSLKSVLREIYPAAWDRIRGDEFRLDAILQAKRADSMEEEIRDIQDVGEVSDNSIGVSVAWNEFKSTLNHPIHSGSLWRRIYKYAQPGDLERASINGKKQLFISQELWQRVTTEIREVDRYEYQPAGWLPAERIWYILSEHEGYAIKKDTVRRKVGEFVREPEEIGKFLSSKESPGAEHRIWTYYHPDVLERMKEWAESNLEKRSDVYVHEYDPSWKSIREIAEEYKNDMSSAKVRAVWDEQLALHPVEFKIMKEEKKNAFLRCSPEMYVLIKSALSEFASIEKQKEGEMNIAGMAEYFGVPMKQIMSFLKKLGVKDAYHERRSPHGKVERYYRPEVIEKVRPLVEHYLSLLPPQPGEKSLYQLYDQVKGQFRVSMPGLKVMLDKLSHASGIDTPTRLVQGHEYAYYPSELIDLAVQELKRISDIPYIRESETTVLGFLKEYKGVHGVSVGRASFLKFLEKQNIPSLERRLPRDNQVVTTYEKQDLEKVIREYLATKRR